MQLLADLSPCAPTRGLAVDEALFEAVRRGNDDIVRFWINDRAVIVGRSQSVTNEVDLVFAKQEGIPVLRRISGGGAVYHYVGNLNLSVILAKSGRSGTVAETFQRLGDAVASGLARVGASVSVRGDGLFVAGAKVGGAAQARRGASCLYHTTVLVKPTELLMHRVLLAMRPGYSPRHVPSRPHPTTTLTDVVGRSVSVEEAAEAILEGLVKEFQSRFRESTLCDGVTNRARALEQTKYRNPKWNALR
jgi:lipoate-protein ligase A